MIWSAAGFDSAFMVDDLDPVEQRAKGTIQTPDTTMDQDLYARLTTKYRFVVEIWVALCVRGPDPKLAGCVQVSGHLTLLGVGFQPTTLVWGHLVSRSFDFLSFHCGGIGRNRADYSCVPKIHSETVRRTV